LAITFSYIFKTIGRLCSAQLRKFPDF